MKKIVEICFLFSRYITKIFPPDMYGKNLLETIIEILKELLPMKFIMARD